MKLKRKRAMVDLLIYLVKVSACMILLYGLYAITLKKETHFRFNRFYLLASAVISFIIPLLHISFDYGISGTGFTYILQTIQVNPGRIFIEQSGLSFKAIVFIIYVTGCSFLFARFLARIISLVSVRRKCRIEKKNGVSLALCKDTIAPFSFFRTIYLNEKTLKNEQADKIIMHETVHIRQLHSIDVIFAEIICMLTWFNPASWMIKAALKETHEYLADSEVSEQAQGSAGYFLLLISNVVGVQPGLANNFNKSLTLKRLNMMKKPRSGRLSLLKALPVLPLVIALFMAFSCNSNTDGQKSPQPTENQKDLQVEKMPEFPGGQEAMTKFIIENVKYPEAAKKNGTQGKVLVTFTVTKAGKITNISISQKVNDLLDAEAARVISIMPDWIPGEDKGAPVDVQMTLPIAFKLE